MINSNNIICLLPSILLYVILRLFYKIIIYTLCNEQTAFLNLQWCKTKHKHKNNYIIMPHTISKGKKCLHH